MTPSALADSDDGFAPGTLGERVADKLLSKIRADGLAPGTRLPSEHAMARHFGVSRTAMRDAIAILKGHGILTTRKGAGAFVCKIGLPRAATDDPLIERSVDSILNLTEVRHGLEPETAALAAVRRTPGQLAEIEHALLRLNKATAAGGDGVEEDVEFHLRIAQATGNPYWVKFMSMFVEQIRLAVTITRANEAQRADFSQQVREEHEKILGAIAAGDPGLARAAAAFHTVRIAERIRQADREFWSGKGGTLARNLAGGLEPSSS